MHEHPVAAGSVQHEETTDSSSKQRGRVDTLEVAKGIQYVTGGNKK